MSFIFSGLQDVEKVFSTASDDLIAGAHFFASDFANFVTQIENGMKELASWLYLFFTNPEQAWNQFISSFLNVFHPVIQAIQGGLSSLLKDITNLWNSFLQDLYSIGKDFLNFFFGFLQGLGHDLASLASSIINNIIQDAVPALGKIYPKITNYSSIFTSAISEMITPKIILQLLPKATEKLSEMLGDIEINLAPIGLGGIFKIKPNEFIESLADTIADFLKDVQKDLTITFFEYIKEPFASDFKVNLRKLFNSSGLGDLPFADPPFQLIARWVGARSYEEIRDHLADTIYLTGYPKWFTDAYLTPPADDYIPKNPLFKPISIHDIITGIQLGILSESALEEYAYNNLITPKTAKLMYKNQTSRIVQRAIEEGIRQFIIKPDEAYNKLKEGLEYHGEQLYKYTFALEYNYAVKRIVRQFLRSLLSRALSNFGRPYMENKELMNTIKELFKKLEYPDEVFTIFEQMINESQQIQTNQLIYQYLIRLAEIGIYDKKQVDEAIKNYKMNKELVESQVRNFINIALINIIKTPLENMIKEGLIDEKETEHLLKNYNFDEQITKALISINYDYAVTKLGGSIIQKLAQSGVLDQKQLLDIVKSFKLNEKYWKTYIDLENNVLFANAEKELITKYFSIGLNYNTKHLNKQYFEILQQAYLITKVTQEKINYYQTLISHGLISQDKAIKELELIGLNKELVPYLVYAQSLKFQLNLQLEYIKEQLKDLEISPVNAEKELEKLGMPKDYAQKYVELYTPTFYNIKTIVKTLIEGAIYKVGRVPISAKGIENELKKLGIPDNQIPILISEYETEIALREWQKYLPSITDIETAIQYNFDLKKYEKYIFIPAELLTFKLDLFQWKIIAQKIFSLIPDYEKLLVYGVNDNILEGIMKRYGVNDALLQVIQLTANLQKILLVYQELEITPQKALTIAEYMPDYQKFLEDTFRKWNVPSELGKTYLTYSRNRKVSRWINQVISSIMLLAEKKKITPSQAQQLLQQFKQYGLTDEEIQLILLAVDLRNQY